MSSEIEQLKLLLEEWSSDLWRIVDDDLVYDGEDADGVPSWEISYGYGYQIECRIGWYVQQGEAEKVTDVLRVMDAMVAAMHALHEALL